MSDRERLAALIHFHLCEMIWNDAEQKYDGQGHAAGQGDNCNLETIVDPILAGMREGEAALRVREVMG